MSARFASSVGALLDPNECFFDCSCKTPLSLMQVNLQLRFLVGIGLINEITLPTTCRWHPGSRVSLDRRQLTLLLQQQFLVPLQIFRACHWLSNHERARPGRKFLVESLVEDPYSSSSLRSLRKRLPTAVLRPCFCSVGRRSCPSHPLKLSGFSRTLSCRLSRENYTGA